MTKMLTLFGEDISKLGYNDLKRERAMQAYLLKILRWQIEKERYYKRKRVRKSQAGDDKISFFEIYITHLETFVKEIDYWLDRRIEPETNCRKGYKRKQDIRAANEIKHRRVMAEDVRALRLSRAIEKDSLYVSWDKDRFLLIASDRGYQTESALIADVAQELVLDRTSAKLLMDKGRFTWGQVLCLGAMLEMTPREFCDTFLAGYFVETQGEFRAAYDNMNKYALLKNAIRPDVIEVGADGKPVNEEEWFDRPSL